MIVSQAVEEKRQIVLRVAESSCFRKAPRLRELLLYVADSTLDGRFDDIHEQTIAEKVFHRSSTYTADDSIVRAHARNLRKRLEMYFETEGQDEPVVISMPRGGYSISFEPRSWELPVTTPIPGASATRSITAVHEPFTHEPVSHQAIPDTLASFATHVAPAPERTEPQGASLATPLAATRSESSRWVLFAALCACCIAAIAYAYYAGFRLTKEPAPLTAPFSALLGNSMDTLVVTSDTALVPLFRGTGQRVNLNDYITRNYPRLMPSPKSEVDLGSEFTDGQEMTIAGLLLQKYARYAGHIWLRSGHHVQMQEFRDHNVILFGSSVSNPWVQMYEGKLNFQTRPQDHSDQIVIENIAPRQGERAEYPGMEQNRSYAHVAFLPASSESGNVLIISGTTAEATAAAGDFVLDGVRMKRALKAAGIDSTGPPAYFEMLLRVNVFAGGFVQADVIASRPR